MAILLRIEGSDASDADAARRARRELRAAIIDESTCRLVAPVPSPGDKGSFHDLLVDVATGSAALSGSAMALTRILLVWLRRDRRRTLTITSTQADNATNITVTGEGIALSTIEAAVRQALGPGLPIGSASEQAPDHKLAGDALQTPAGDIGAVDVRGPERAGWVGPL
jgi:Effector Associated Constant Component 1